MPGLVFDEGPEVDPETPLGPLVLDWAVALAGRGRSPRTVRGYVSDAGVFADALAAHRGRPVPPAEPVEPVPGSVLARLLSLPGMPPAAWARLTAATSVLVLADLAPVHLGVAYDHCAAGRAPATQRRLAAAWSSLCAHLVRRGLLASNPMHAGAVVPPHRPRGAPKPLPGAELGRLLQVATEPDPAARPASRWPARDLALVAVFLSTGVRLEEARTARVGDFAPTETASSGWVLRVRGKGSKDRTVPLHAEAADTLHTYLAERAGRLGDGQPVGGDAVLFVRADASAYSPTALRRQIERLYSRAGVRRHPGAAVHALRHTFATTALSSGTTVRELQQLLGHESLTTTSRYLDVDAGELRAAVDAHVSRALLRQLAEQSPNG